MCAEVKSVSIDVGKGEVLVESALTTAEVQALIENTGRRAVLKGIGGSEQGKKLQKEFSYILYCMHGWIYFLDILLGKIYIYIYTAGVK